MVHSQAAQILLKRLVSGSQTLKPMPVWDPARVAQDALYNAWEELNVSK